jgi:hypothetical protein
MSKRGIWSVISEFPYLLDVRSYGAVSAIVRSLARLMHTKKRPEFALSLVQFLDRTVRKIDKEIVLPLARVYPHAVASGRWVPPPPPPLSSPLLSTQPQESLAMTDVRNSFVGTYLLARQRPEGIITIALHRN